MSVFHFFCNQKCAWNCLNCLNKENLPIDIQNVESVISKAKKNDLFLFSQVYSAELIQKSLNLIKKKKAYSGIIFNSFSLETTNFLPVDFVFFPFFSLSSELHDQYSGKRSFYKQISVIKNLKNKKKIVLFFFNRDNISELVDLPGFCWSLGVKAWVIPFGFFSDFDFNQENMQYIKRVNNYRGLNLFPVHQNFKIANVKTKICFFERLSYFDNNFWDRFKTNNFIKKLAKNYRL